MVLRQCFLTFSGFVHPCLRLLHSHSPYCECMADVTVITVHRMFIVIPHYLLFFINSVLSAMQQIGYDLQMWFACSFAKCIFVSSAHALFLVLAESITTDKWREFYCLHKYSCCYLKNCEDLF